MHSSHARSVLVAGGAGYIGSHVCKAMAAAGLLPVTFDNLITGKRDFVKFGPLVEANISDPVAVRHAVSEYKVDSVVDLAGSIEVAESVADPLKYYENNLAAKISFLRTLHACGVKAFVFSSTAAVYGEPTTVPIPETHALSPKNPYGMSKLGFEHVLRDFYAAGGSAFMALRYFNAAGASADGDIGEAHEPESHLIPRACFAALGRSGPLEVYGNDYPTPDKTAIRDYIHVSDLASAHLLAVDALLKGAPPAAYNLGTSTGTSVGEVLACFKRLGWPVPHAYKPRRAGDPARLVADAAAARRQLGWTPRLTAIDDIVRSAYRWHEANPLRKTG